MKKARISSGLILIILENSRVIIYHSKGRIVVVHKYVCSSNVEHNCIFCRRSIFCMICIHLRSSILVHICSKFRNSIEEHICNVVLHSILVPFCSNVFDMFLEHQYISSNLCSMVHNGNISSSNLHKHGLLDIHNLHLDLGNLVNNL